MSFEVIISALVALGVGGVLGYYVQYILQHKKDIESDIHKLKRERYGSILIQMLIILDPKSLSKAQKFRQDFRDIKDVKEEIKTEMLNSIIYANDDVIRTMSIFLKNPVKATFIAVALAMRKDLWGKKTNLHQTTFIDLVLEDLKDIEQSA